MSAELLEVGQMAGLIVGAWFALIGWKLVPLMRAPRPSRPGEF